MSNQSYPLSTDPSHYDPRFVSWGFARIFMAFLTCWSLGLIVAEFWQLPQVSWDDYGWALASLAGSFLWLVISIGIIHNGRRVRTICWAGLCVQLIEILTFTFIGWYSDDSAQRCLLFFEAGRHYFYSPLFMLLTTSIWMLWFSPLRRA